MYKGRRVIALVPAFNEEAKVGRVIERTDFRIVDSLLVIDDGSTDATAGVAEKKGADVISLPKRSGVGAAIREGLLHARQGGFDLAVVMAGNDKDDPAEMRRLLDPICDDEFDFVMGSRFCRGGRHGGDMPIYRKLATRLHPWLVRRFTGQPITESTNGFRGFRLALLDDPRINLNQRWLDTYGLEIYLLWKVLKLGYRHAEVPCTKRYPSKKLGYTKMRPIIDWWMMLRPIFLLGFGLRH